MSEEKHGLFKVGQNIILINDKSELLVIKENHHNLEHKWNWPGGRLNEGENWEEGLRREINEELNLDEFDLIGIHSVRTWISKANIPHYTVLFIGKISNNSNIKLNSKELADYAWVSRDTVNDFENLEEGMNRDIKDILSKYAK